MGIFKKNQFYFKKLLLVIGLIIVGSVMGKAPKALGYASCFLPGTPVQMADGTTKAIEKVKIGDQVMGYDLKKKQFTVNTVEELESPIRKKWFKIVLNNGRTIRTTSEHPIYITDFNDWASLNPQTTWEDTHHHLKVHQLKVNQHVFDFDKRKTKIIKIIEIPEEVRTYNLKKVSNNSTYFAEGVLVHNKCFDYKCVHSAWYAYYTSACSAACGGGTKTVYYVRYGGLQCAYLNSQLKKTISLQNLSNIFINIAYADGGDQGPTCGTEYKTVTERCNTQPCPCVHNWCDNANANNYYTDQCCTGNCLGYRCGTKVRCTDSYWSPPTSSYCSGTYFTQTSNCGNHRVTTGTKYCCTDSYWSPPTSSYCSGTYFTQTSNCGTTRRVRGTRNCIPAPTVTLTASPNPVGYNSASTLSWHTTNASSCYAYGAWSGWKNNTRGSQSTGNLTSAKTYQIECWNSAGVGTGRKSVTVSVNAAPVSINGSCGTANQAYPASATSFGSDTFCSAGTPNPTNPIFPSEGSVVTWICNGSNGGSSSSCSATHQSSCVPNDSCAANTCIGQTCDNGCGTPLDGTKTCYHPWKEVAP